MFPKYLHKKYSPKNMIYIKKQEQQEFRMLKFQEADYFIPLPYKW